MSIEYRPGIGRCVRVAPTGFRSAKLVGILASGLLLLGCQTIPPTSTAGLTPAQASLVRQTCIDIMGVRSGGAEFGACSDSLADSIHRLTAAQEVAQAHEDCERQGFTPQSAGLARCVVLAEQESSASISPAGGTRTAAEPPTADLPNVPRLSFYKMSRPERHERERLACAQVGIDPITREFGQCVGEMAQAFWDLENPL